MPGPRRWALRGVAILPGASELTLMWWRPSSTASALARPPLDRRALERRRHVRSGDGNHRGRAEPQRWTDELTLERGRASIVADEQICQPERPMIHRPGRREAGSQMPEAPGIILHRRLKAGLDDLPAH